jgi:spermidine synthase
MSNILNEFWKFMDETGYHANNINKIRKEYKKTHGKKYIKNIDDLFTKYHNKIKHRLNLSKKTPYYDSIIKYIVFNILSRGKDITHNFLNNEHTFIDKGNTNVHIDVIEKLLKIQSKFQKIKVVKTKNFGNALIIDNDINVTESDEKNYHEMIVHVPMAYKFLNAKNALIIGGGDGGTARELLRYNHLNVTMIEIDKEVINASKQFLPSTAISFQNPRLNLIIGDGAEYIKNYNGKKFDIIIVDSTDFNQALQLFTIDFYKNISNNLNKDGIFVFNNDSVYKNRYELIINPVLKLKKIFKYVFPYQLFMPTYNGIHYTMMFCSNVIHPINTKINSKKWYDLNIDTDYYNLGVHLGSFYLPNELSKKLNDKLNKC